MEFVRRNVSVGVVQKIIELFGDALRMEKRSLDKRARLKELENPKKIATVYVFEGNHKGVQS